MGLLDGRVAIVTGAGRGIGAEIAKLFAAEGAAVVVNDVGTSVTGAGEDAHVAHEVVAEIRASSGQAVANTSDISDYTESADIVRQAIDEFGKVDVLVNVAGILRDRMIFNMTEDEWDAVIRVHMRGTFCTTRHASAYWRGLRVGEAQHRVINFTSGGGLYGSIGSANYGAAKMGIVGFTYSCALALRKYGVTVNAISPHADTRMMASVPEEWREREESAEFAPQNVAPAVAYVASVRSGWLNGQVLSAGGYKVALVSQPHEVARLLRDEPWSVSQVSEQIERYFRPLVGA